MNLTLAALCIWFALDIRLKLKLLNSWGIVLILLSGGILSMLFLDHFKTTPTVYKCRIKTITLHLNHNLQLNSFLFLLLQVNLHIWMTTDTLFLE